MDDLGDIKLIYLRKGVDIEEFKSKIAKHLDGEVVLELPEVTADTTSVLQFLEGFIPIFNMFIGLLTTLIAIGMTIFTAFDIAYIAFPVVREKCEDAKISGKGTMTKQGKNGQTELRWVSDDAQFVVSECSVENGRSPWWLYFKRRIVSYIMLAIILFILLTGNIQLITNIVLNVVSGIVEVLQSLAA